MRSILGSSLTALAVLYVLSVLLSGHRNVPGGAGLITNSERISNIEERLIQAIVLRRQQQSSDYPASPNADRPIKVQQALKDDRFYSGRDGSMRQSTRETLGPFHESNHLNVSGTVDDDTGRELGIHIIWRVLAEVWSRRGVD